MTDLFLERTIFGFKPAEGESRDKCKAWAPGEIVKVKASKPRDGQQHKRFFVMLDFIFQHWPDKLGKPPPKSQIRSLLLVGTGRHDMVSDPVTGKTWPEPHSMSFASMDGPTFTEFYSECGRLAASRYLECSDEEFFDNLRLFEG